MYTLDINLHMENILLLNRKYPKPLYSKPKNKIKQNMVHVSYVEPDHLLYDIKNNWIYYMIYWIRIYDIL